MRLKFITMLPLSAVLCGGTLVPGAQAVELPASPPARVTLSLFDRGFALVQELRRANMVSGENLVTFNDLPAKLDPSSVSITPATGPRGVSTLEHRFAFDLADMETLFSRYLGETIAVSQDGNVYQGSLVHARGFASGDTLGVSPLSIRSADGDLVTFLSPDQVKRIGFPDASARAFLEPTLLWKAEAAQEGPQNLRVSYFTEGLTWGVAYDCVLAADGQTASLQGRAILRNHSGMPFRNARVRLVVTEKGQQEGIIPEASSRQTLPLRYAYGSSKPTFEREAASSGVLGVYPLDGSLEIGDSETRHFKLVSAGSLPVNKFYVYDGVRFDRFQRNRRNDWNYGTESHRTVHAHVEFDNQENGPLGQDLPPGRFRLYTEEEDGRLDLLSEEQFIGAETGSRGNLVMGPAKGLIGERERTGYAEVTPLHEYEESFEIRLSNLTDEDAEIRVVEHLYRWPEYEIVKADTEYTEPSEQVLEFRPVLKPGGKRSIRYTVRYSW